MSDPDLHPVTLTHARIRARQGDRAGAERILLAFLEREPADPSARKLLEQVRRMTGRPTRGEEHLPAAVRTPARPAALAAHFRRELAAARDPRVARLERWLARVLRG